MAALYKINYKSDFVLTINSDAGWAVPFCIKFWTGMPSQAYFAGFDGENYVNCRVGETPTQLLVMFDDHHMPIGELKMQIAYHTTIEEFPDRKFDEVTNPTNVTVDIDGTEYQVMLDFTGETGAEIDFSMPSSGVMSVNGKIGYVTLNAEDVGAQPTIEDLATIRSGAAAGATAVQPDEMTAALATKQDVIEDLATIRSGAAAGATAVQPAAMNTALAAKQDTLTFDNTPTANSDNPVKSGGIKTALDAKQNTISTVNVSVDNNTGTPSGSASVSGSTLSLSFQNLKGATGATGATGPQGPQGERGLPGESGVTGDVSGFTVIQTIDPSATYGATDIAGAATVQATNQELTEIAGKLNGVEFEEKGVTFFSGQKLEDTHGSATADTNAQRTGYINIGKLEEGDVIVWSGTVKNNILALYDSDYKFVEYYTATGSTRTITVSSTVAALNVVYIRITFSASRTPAFTINGKNILNQKRYELALDEDLDKHLPAEGIAVGERMRGVESAINDTMVTTSASPTLKNGYVINVNGKETATGGWSCTDYIKIPTLNNGDSIYWGGISANISANLAFYDSFKNLIDVYTAAPSPVTSSSRTITFTNSSVVVINDAQYIRASFSGSPVLTLNGNTLFTKHQVVTDSTMTLDMPANAKGVSEFVGLLTGVSIFKNGYFINMNGDEEKSEAWCYAMIDLDTPIKAGDVFVWSGFTDKEDALLYVYRDDGSHISGWSAIGEPSRTFTISNSSVTIGATKIKVSFSLSSNNRSVSINGVVQEFSVIKEDRSVSEYNADKQPMVVSLSRTKLDVSTLKKYFCFAQITDTHGENDLVQRAVDFVNSEVFGSSIDCLVHTGDVQKTSFTEGDMSAFHNAMDNSVKPAFTVIGNHDVWNRTSNADLFNRYMKPMVDKGLLVAGTNIDAASYATWYYYDFTEYSIRLIALNDFDPLWDGWSIGSSVMNTTAYSPAQIDFLISTLQSVPSGYTVIIVDHYPSNKGTGYSGTIINVDWTMETSPIGSNHSSLFTDHQSPMIDVLEAYKVKGTLQRTYTFSNSTVQSYYGDISVDVDFSQANGILAFMACGHNHNDAVFKFTDKNDVMGISMLGGVNPTIIDSRTKILRTYSGKAHDAINVYCVRTDERKVYVIRIGADFRADGKEQVITSFEY